MTRFADFAALGRRLERARGRLEKRDEVARFLKALPPDEIATAVAFLAGRAFPASDPRVLGVRGLPRESSRGPDERDAESRRDPGSPGGDERGAESRGGPGFADRDERGGESRRDPGSPGGDERGGVWGESRRGPGSPGRDERGGVRGAISGPPTRRAHPNTTDIDHAIPAVAPAPG